MLLDSVSIPRVSTQPFDVVAVATSLGGLDALSQVFSSIPPDFPAAIVVVQHLSARHHSNLASILSRRAALPVAWVTDGAELRPGMIVITPPDRHVVVSEDSTLTLSDDPKVQFVRPSADRLFVSIARSYQERAIGVVLTGALHDGAAGVRAIKQSCGRVLVQDAATSRALGMPSAAISTQCIDFVLPLPLIAHALVSLVMVPGAASLLRRLSPPLVSPSFSPPAYCTQAKLPSGRGGRRQPDKSAPTPSGQQLTAAMCETAT